VDFGFDAPPQKFAQAQGKNPFAQSISQPLGGQQQNLDFNFPPISGQMRAAPAQQAVPLTGNLLDFD